MSPPRLVTRAVPIRVLLVSARFPPYVGGIERHVSEIAPRLAARGFEVRVLTTDIGGELPPWENHDGVAVQRIRAFPSGRDYYFAPRLWRAIRTSSSDLVHVHGYQTLVGPMALWAARRMGLPRALTLHSGPDANRLRSALRGVRHTLLRPLLRDCRLIAVSRFEADQFAKALRLDRGRIGIIPSGADMPQVGVPPSADPRILSVGRLERYKGHHRIVAAMPLLLERLPGVRLRIVGSGSQQRALRHQAMQLGVAQQVEIGAIDPADRVGMASLIASSSLLVQLSDYESFGIAALEAMWLGRPVLVTYTAALAEWADRGMAAAVDPDPTPAAVADAVARQLSSPVVADRSMVPTWDTTADALGAVYRSILRAKSSGADQHRGRRQ